jgi:hypothetical protein
MKRLQIIVLLLCTLSLAGCARGCQSWKRGLVENHPQRTKVTLLSGGDTIQTWEFTGIVNNDAESIFFYDDNGKGIEIDGDVLIEYLD